MAADSTEKLAHVVESHSELEGDGEVRQLYLRAGRTLSVTGRVSEELVEIRASSGQLELRIRMTDAGPVLQMESVRIQLKASEAIDLETKQFNVKTDEGIVLESQGAIKIAGEADVRVDAKGEVHVSGKMIYLN